MIFRKRLKDPQVMMFIGMVVLVLGNTMQIVGRYVNNEALVDGTRGFFLGIAISLLLLSVRLKARGAGC